MRAIQVIQKKPLICGVMACIFCFASAPYVQAQTNTPPTARSQADHTSSAFGIDIEETWAFNKQQEKAPVYSRIIFKPDYSDTFTEGAVIERFRPLHYGVSNPSFGLPVERKYDNREALWSPDFVFVNDDTASSTPLSPYPGGSGRDSATGFVEIAHDGATAFGIRYGVRTDTVVQFQAVQPSEYVAVAVGDITSRGNLQDPTALVVRFYYDGRITVVTREAGEHDTGLRTRVRLPWQWYNYGVRFDLDDKRLEFYHNEHFVGTVKIAELGDHAFAGTTYSTEAVSLGAAGGDRFWVDDFQIGAPFDEPVGPKFNVVSWEPLYYGGDSSYSYELPDFEPGVPDIGVTVIPAPAALPAGLFLLSILALRRRKRRFD